MTSHVSAIADHLTRGLTISYVNDRLEVRRLGHDKIAITWGRKDDPMEFLKRLLSLSHSMNPIVPTDAVCRLEAGIIVGGVSSPIRPPTLASWQAKNFGPTPLLVGGQIRYSRRECEEWFQALAESERATFAAKASGAEPEIAEKANGAAPKLRRSEEQATRSATEQEPPCLDSLAPQAST